MLGLVAGASDRAAQRLLIQLILLLDAHDLQGRERLEDLVALGLLAPVDARARHRHVDNFHLVDVVHQRQAHAVQVGNEYCAVALDSADVHYLLVQVAYVVHEHDHLLQAVEERERVASALTRYPKWRTYRLLL